MHIELGTGCKKIIFYNADKSDDIDAMLARIAAAHNAMISAEYPSAVQAKYNYKLIFTSESIDCDGLRIHISSRPCGIYTNNFAYHKQLAHKLFTMTGFEIHHIDTANIEIGIGGLDAQTQGFVMLKDALPAICYCGG